MTKSGQYLVYADNTVIGMATINHWDRSMGVAGGPFEPTDQYMPTTHAAVLNGADLVQERGQPALVLIDAKGDRLGCDTVAVLDYAATVGSEGREITVFGVRSLPSLNVG